jgi:hypothetical protein
MAAFLYNSGSMNLWDGTIDLLTETLAKLAFYDNSGTYTADRDDDWADEGGANDFVDAEPDGTGYTGGYGGSGRHALSSKTITVDKASDRSEFDAADETWSSIDVGELGGMVLLVEDAGGTTGDDTETRLVGHDDVNFPVTTNGGDLTIQIADLIRLSTV